ncbi:nuclease-related domain-containing protein [Neobacillus sp. NPDC097160]|uniref:nuclease-related domain-containing protein n=1 Tax=Neobacillus sp. NPDC097160 TaxID=3364298 RepID=UPI0037F68197
MILQTLKTRSEPTELIKLRFLNARMMLGPKEKRYYFNLEKGYQGEVMFDQLTQKLQNDLYIINDLRLESNNAEFQIDTLIIAQETIYPFEVKNHEGDYYYEAGNFFSMLTEDEIKNPLDQLKRSKWFLPLRALLALSFYLGYSPSTSSGIIIPFLFQKSPEPLKSRATKKVISHPKHDES